MKKIIFILVFCLFMLTATSAYAKTSAELFDELEARCVYTDENNVIKMAAFKIDEVPADMVLEINGETYAVTEAPVDGMVYQSVDTQKTAEGIISISFFAEGESAVFETPAVKIVSGKEGEWTASDDGHRLYTYNGSDEEVVVPNFYNNKPIVVIGGRYENESYINILDGKTEGFKKIYISDGITGIHHCTFRGIATLEDIRLPETLVSIGGISFYETGLNCPIELPKTTRIVYGNAFRDTKITSLKLNEGLEYIYPQAFINCKNIGGELVLPESLVRIGYSAFYGCSGLKGPLTIPAGVKAVEKAAFYNCSGFNGKLTLCEGVESVGLLCFGGYGVNMGFTELELPSSLKQIDAYAFQNCVSVKRIELKEGLEAIGDGAFDHCCGAENEKLVIPSTVKTIGGDYNVEENTLYGDHVFYDFGKDESFKEFEVAEGNTNFDTIGGVLYDAAHTRMIAYPRGKTDETFILPDTVTQLDALSFSRPAYLKKLVLPDSYVLSTEVPKNSLNIDGNSLSVALYGFNNISEIAVSENNPNYTTKDGLLYSKDMKTLWYIPLGIEGEVNIDSRCEKMEKGCVYIASAAKVMWEKLVIGGGIKTIDDNTVKMINDNIKQKISIENSFYLAFDKDGKICAASYKYGDADLSGQIDAADAELVLKYICGINVKDKINLTAADIDQNGVINLLDVISIKALA